MTKKSTIGDNAPALESPQCAYEKYFRGELDRNGFARALEEPAKRIARQVASGGIGNQRQDFIEDVLFTLFLPRQKAGPRIDAYSPDKGSIESWLTSVLDNAWTDEVRKNKHRKEVNLATNDNFNWVADCREFPLAISELSPRDLDKIQQWPLRNQLVGMLLGGLFLSLSEEDWETIISAYEEKHGTTLPRPFPPDDFVDVPDPSDLYGPLTILLELSRGNILQVVKRTRDRLKDLLVIRELLDTSGKMD